MNILRISLVLICVFGVHIFLIGQEKKTNPFTNGQPIGLVFANFHAGINQGDNPSAFEVRRVYLGYKINLNENFSTKVQLDIGSPNNASLYSLQRRYAYFKEANLQYKKGKVTARFGIIPLQQFKVQEKMWGHRYIYESVLDEHGVGSSADLGASINYKATSFLELDLTFMNGEGYSKLQTDNSYKAGLGLTLKPWKGLVVRGYVDAIQKSEMMITIVNFVGYQISDKLYFGVECDFRLNNGFEKDQNNDIYSTYLSYNFTDKIQLFGRYDYLSSNGLESEANPWNIINDGSAIIAGIQYKPIEKVKIALNYQDWYPYAEDQNNEAFIYLNLEFRAW